MFCLNECLINLYFWVLFLLMMECWDDSFSSFSILKLMLYFLLDCIVFGEKSTVICFSIMCLVFSFKFILRVSEFLGCFLSLILGENGRYLFNFFCPISPCPPFFSVTLMHLCYHLIMPNSSWNVWFSLHTLSSLYFS